MKKHTLTLVIEAMEKNDIPYLKKTIIPVKNKTKKPDWYYSALSLAVNFEKADVVKLFLTRKKETKYNLMSLATSDPHCYDSFNVTKLLLQKGYKANDLNIHRFYGVGGKDLIRWVKLLTKHKINPRYLKYIASVDAMAQDKKLRQIVFNYIDKNQSVED
jgi:hypothetical protein